MSSGNLQAGLRDKVGSRHARRLRAQGRVPASLQGEGASGKDEAVVHLHVALEDFMTARRKHVHLFDLELGGSTEAAVVRELQWSPLGDSLMHVEFKRVQRGVETESEVPLEFYGNVVDGILTHLVTHVTIRCLPSIIPDLIEVNVGGLAVGARIKASDLVLPEGVFLAEDADVEVAIVTAPRVEEEPAEAAEEVVEPIVESDEKREKREAEAKEEEKKDKKDKKEG